MKSLVPFQGRHANAPYFEGWYFKITDPESGSVFALIPGVSLGQQGADSHSFIQYIDGTSGKSGYCRFPLDAFKTQDHPFRIEIAGNVFSLEEMKIDLKDDHIHADLLFSGITPWEGSLFAPGAMGPFAYIPGMECNHHVVSFHHSVSGILNWGKKKNVYRDARGYIEKDWGHSFPSAWIWMQCNGFQEKDVSLMVSIATVPWMFSSFKGFIIILHCKGKRFDFATWNFSSIKRLEISESQVLIEVRNPRQTLHILASRKRSGTLQAPVMGKMVRPISESVSSEVEIRLFEGTNSLFHGRGFQAGLEVVGSV